MPIEIKELHIKAVIAPPGRGSSPASGPGSAASGGQNVDKMVNICVEKVLEILREKEER